MSEGFTKEVSKKFIQRNRFLLQIEPDKMRKSFQALRQLNFLHSDIKIHPRVLLQTDYQLINNYQRLQEVGFNNVTTYRLANVKKFFANSIYYNQSFNFLPKDINILEQIFSVAQVPIALQTNQMAYEREMKLIAVHQMALRLYLLDHVEYTAMEIDRLFHYFPALKLRSLQSIDKTAKLLMEIYNVPVKSLPRSILAMQPEDIIEIMKMEEHFGIDVRKVMLNRPGCTLSHIQEIQQICWSFNIPNYALKYTPKIFNANVDKLKERLNTISKLKRADEFFRNVAIGRVILGIERIRTYATSKNVDFDSIFNDAFVE